MTDSGWFNVNLVTIDLTNPSVKSTVLLPEYISQKATLMDLAKSEDDVVAAINGDFFDTQGQSTLGMVVKDGEYITSSIHDDRFYTYLQLDDGRSYIAKVLGESTKLTKDGFSLDITYKNKPYLQYDRAIVFDRNWGNASIGNTNSESVIEMVVVDDTIVSIALDHPLRKSLKMAISSQLWAHSFLRFTAILKLVTKWNSKKVASSAILTSHWRWG